jgi:hypothetical protein
LSITGAVTAAVGSASPASPGQQDPSTTTRPEILVPGPTVGSSTTVAESTTTSAAAESGFLDGLKEDVRDMLADETGRTVAIAIGGLILVALILAVLTIRYWRKTRPVRPPKATDG